MKVFLGGTYKNSNWRDELIPMLEEHGVDYFNPVVENWDKYAQELETIERDTKCDTHLYVITPEATGSYTIAEVIHSAHQIANGSPNIKELLFLVYWTEDNPLSQDKINSFNATMKLMRSIDSTRTITSYVHSIEEIFDKLIYEQPK